MKRAEADPRWQLIRLGCLHTPMAVRVCATLRLVDHIISGATTRAELTDRTGTDAMALARLIRHLIAIGILAEPEPGRLAPTELGQVLADDHPAGQRAWHDLTQVVARADISFIHLLDAVQTGRGTYEKVYGKAFYDDLAECAELRESFEELFSCDRQVAYEAPVAAYDWTKVQHVLDVGGGTGGFVATIAHSHPQISATLLELPGTAEAARKVLAKDGLAERVSVVEGDFREGLPGTADAILLSFVLLNWPDKDAIHLLDQCRRALNRSGRILVLERDDLPENSNNEQFTELDLRMLVFLGGRLRTRPEWTSLATAAGLAVEAVHELPSATIPFDLSLLVLAEQEGGSG